MPTIAAASSRKCSGSHVKNRPARNAKSSEATERWWGLILASRLAAGESILSASPL
ncbi:MAG: hypothetical protein AB1793_04555 [Candidatus Thermoplasmatota archaeon]